MSHKKLLDALSNFDWGKNLESFSKNIPAMTKVYECNYKLAIWSKQFENVDSKNPALSFIREMQNAGYHVVILISLALYKPAAASMRIVFETALFYSFFRTHLCELSTLIRDENYFMQKADIINYHKIHTDKFIELQSKFNLINRLDKWYRYISSIVHGQIPGEWIKQTELSEIQHRKELNNMAVETFCEGVEIIHHFFLCTTDSELWNGFSSTSKKDLLKGLSGEIKDIISI